MMSHLRDDVHISGHVANHEYWHHPPTMTHSSSPPNHINHHHPSSNPFYPPSMFQLHPQYLHHHPSSYEPYYYPNHYPSAESLAIESGSVCDLDQKPSLSSSVITPCTNYSSSPCSSSVVEPVTPIAALPPTSLPSSEMTQLRLSDQTLKSSPGSPLSHPTMHEQLGHQTTVNFHSTPCSGITSRPQAARSPFEWINTKKQPGVTQSMDGQTYPSSQPPPGKTRTRDKYRVVYSDHQRMELEKEFEFSPYITIRKKTELASQLGLSERQIKIWFQNRRAKNRKIKKKQEQIQCIPQEHSRRIMCSPNHYHTTVWQQH